MIYMFANVWFFNDMFNSYEFQEKQNIEYQPGRRATSRDFHDDLRGSQGDNIEYQLGCKAKSEDLRDDLNGSQGLNIEYQQGRRAKVNVFHVIQEVRM